VLALGARCWRWSARFLSAIDGRQIHCTGSLRPELGSMSTKAYSRRWRDKIARSCPNRPNADVADVDTSDPDALTTWHSRTARPTGVNDGLILVELKGGHARPSTYVRQVRAACRAAFPGRHFYVQRRTRDPNPHLGFRRKSPCVTSATTGQLILRVAQELSRALPIPGVADALSSRRSNARRSTPKIDRLRAAQLGLNASQCRHQSHVS